ncbi:hypothetical protein [Glaciibacter sp. 2TAF33]|uniref:hypothetical protein n=1 Tax=Glaciibacter sp. 2TAF33 TaxID=3233015 RepID=UPI003F93030E
MSLATAKRFRAAILGLAFAAAVLAVLLGSVAPGARAATTPEPMPAERTPATSTPSAASGSPEITSPPDRTFVGLTSTVVSGTRAADQAVQLLSPVPGHDPLCIIAPDGTTAWSCTAGPLPSGPAVTLRVVVSGNAGLGDSITVPILGPPTVTGGASGQPFSDGRLRGIGYPGASVTVTVTGGRGCTTDADSSGAWACTVSGVSNGDARVTARQQSDDISPSSSNDSQPVVIRFDVTTPAPPIVTAPVTGAHVPLGATTYSGTGEDGATVTVFAGPYSVCTTPVADGRWSCSGSEVAAGSYAVIALQQDAAGNASPGSEPITVLYGAEPTATVTPEPTTGAPTGGSTPSQGASQSPSQSPSQGGPPPSAGQAGPPTSPPSATQPPAAGGAGPNRPQDPGGWSDPTRFTAAVLPPGDAGAFPWQQALVLALGALVLFAIPARLLAGTLSRAMAGRRRWHPAQLTGRNRAREEFETAPQFRVSRALVAPAALIAAAALVVLSGPVSDQPAYLRLLVAVVIALGLVNAVATLVPWWWSTRVLRVAASVSFLPRYLLLVAVTALGSRVFDLHPALLFGLLGSVAVTQIPTAAVRGQLAAVRAASLLALALVGWLALGAVPLFASDSSSASGGFAAALVAEVTNTVVLTAIGSAVLVLIPVGRTSGRGVLAWSPPIWAGLTVLAFAMLFIVLSPSVLDWHNGAGTLLWVAAAAFAALSVGTWAWQRFVVPALR